MWPVDGTTVHLPSCPASSSQRQLVLLSIPVPRSRGEHLAIGGKKECVCWVVVSAEVVDKPRSHGESGRDRRKASGSGYVIRNVVPDAETGVNQQHLMHARNPPCEQGSNSSPTAGPEVNR